MTNQDQTLCDACLNEVAGVLSLNDYAGDLVCDQCMGEIKEMIEDHFNDDMTEQVIDDYWRIEQEAEAYQSQYDDDPNPYHGTYSE